ncbi:hypothetical protein ACLVWU_17705 [Bdellovibrio sp. HCB290]|uniref:hypothetical protein n=1 Tax=Bdellovibrio sp. HCB290 TaxID=3394356 RepID=UPI0039B6AE67
MEYAKLTGIKNFLKHHWEKIIFLNCISGALALYYRNILYTLDGGGRYASGKDLLEVGLHGFNDHYFLGGIQNLFYPPLHDFLLAIVIKFNSWLPTGGLDDRGLYSLFVFALFSFYIYSLYRVSRSLDKLVAKVFFIVFASWTLYLNVYSFEKNFGHSLNFYDNPVTMFFQGLTLQDIYVTGITNQFLSAGFLVLAILSFQKRDKSLTALWISLTILSHYIFGFVAVLVYLIKKIFEKDIRSLIHVGVISFGLTAFFLIPMLVNGKYLVTLESIPTRTGFWLTLVGFSFLFFKNKTFSYYLAFAAFVFVSFIGIAKISLKYHLPIVPFHYYRFLFISLILFVFAVAFALNEPISWKRKVSIFFLFIIAWVGNFGGHFTPSYFLWWYSPKVVSMEPAQLNDFSAGRTYFFGVSRGVDFVSEIKTHLLNERSFFMKGLYWESAPANKLISSSLFYLTGPPSVLDGDFKNPFKDKSCEAVNCFFKSLLNQTAVTEVFMPPYQAVLDYFFQDNINRYKLVSCYNNLLSSLGPQTGAYSYEALTLNRYLNHETAIVRTFKPDAPPASVDLFYYRCTKNPTDDGRVPDEEKHVIVRVSSGNYEIQSQPGTSEVQVAMQYFPGFRYDNANEKELIPRDVPAGMVLKVTEITKLYYQRSPIMWMSYVISLASWISFAAMGLAHIRRKSRLSK